MSSLDEIKKRNERRNQLMNARKDEFNMLREVEYQRLVNDSVEDIELLLAKLEQAEDALIHLDRVISFKKMGKPFDLPTDIKTGTELMMWEERNNHILALNNAKKFAAETLEKLKD